MRVEFHFNPGGPAVWGETYIHIHRVGNPFYDLESPKPVVEACLSVDFSYMRQWNGQHSGRNRQVSYIRPLDPPAFAMAVRELERRPFVRF